MHEVLKPSLLGYTAPPMFDIPVVEYEKLIREILSFIHLQLDNGFELADKAREWFLILPHHYSPPRPAKKSLNATPTAAPIVENASRTK